MRQNDHEDAALIQKKNSPNISIVIPAHNEAASLSETLNEVLQVLSSNSIAAEILVVDDGSTDGTWSLVQEFSSRDQRVRGICFSRNFGKERAICAGLEFSSGQAVVVMDADLQHPPRVIPELVEKWSEGFNIVDGVKRSRGKESWLSRRLAKGFYGFFALAAGIDLEGQSDFKLLDRRAVEEWKRMPERTVFFRGMSSWLGFRRTSVEFDVEDRAAGSSKWSRASLAGLALSAITSFSSIPLRLVTSIGLLFLLFAVILGIQTVYKWAIGEAFTGFPTVILLILITSSLVMLALGVIGEYLAKIYDEIKGRPRFVIEDRCGFDEASRLDGRMQ